MAVSQSLSQSRTDFALTLQHWFEQQPKFFLVAPQLQTALYNFGILLFCFQTLENH